MNVYRYLVEWKAWSLRSAGLLALLAPLCGCHHSYVDTPDDLTFRSVQVVDEHDQSELPSPGSRSNDVLRNGRRVFATEQPFPRRPSPHTPILKVEFSSSTNLSKFSIENGISLRNITFFCRSKETSPWMAWLDIYWNGTALADDPDKRIDQLVKTSGTPIIYYLFIYISRTQYPTNPIRNEDFDLRQKSEDICFFVGGATDSDWASYTSNTVVIPKSAIDEALRKAPSVGY
jgi:hypothetical protein